MGLSKFDKHLEQKHFCSRITFLSSFHFVYLAKSSAPGDFLGNLAVLDLIRLGFCDTSLLVKLPKMLTATAF